MNFRLLYQRPNAVKEDLSVEPSILGFTQEVIDFSAKTKKEADQWVECFVEVGMARVRDPKPLFRQHGPNEPFDREPKFIEVPKRKPLLLVQVIKQW